MGPGSRDQRNIFNHHFCERERHERGVVVAKYANGLAHVRRAWGSTASEAHAFTGDLQYVTKSYEDWATLITELTP